ncbi:helix-turn-helix transcriptional regulator [Vibrio parahaemolyticus]|nr:helix-turn-helix transcriptional regulator [Vibrio parahaemolyticus]
MMIQNVTGLKIKEIRKSKGITQEVMVARLQSSGFDMTRSTYSKVELQLRQVRDIELIAFAKALNVDVGEFFN